MLYYLYSRRKEDDMSKYTFIVNPKVKEILELSESLRKCLEYPNSENSMDERRYSEFFEQKILDVIKRKK